MVEVEAKVKLSPSEYHKLLLQLKKEAKYLGTKQNEDFYYGDLNICTMRIRRNANKYSFDLKLRETIAGIESNTELEWRVKDASKWRAVLKKLGLSTQVRKSKKSENFNFQGFHVELNQVRGLGYYLEIEKLVTDRAKVPSTKKELINLFVQLGFSTNQFEPKRYLELLNYV